MSKLWVLSHLKAITKRPIGVCFSFRDIVSFIGVPGYVNAVPGRRGGGRGCYEEILSYLEVF